MQFNSGNASNQTSYSKVAVEIESALKKLIPYANPEPAPDNMDADQMVVTNTYIGNPIVVNEKYQQCENMFNDALAQYKEQFSKAKMWNPNTVECYPEVIYGHQNLVSRLKNQKTILEMIDLEANKLLEQQETMKNELKAKQEVKMQALHARHKSILSSLLSCIGLLEDSASLHGNTEVDAHIQNLLRQNMLSFQNSLSSCQSTTITELSNTLTEYCELVQNKKCETNSSSCPNVASAVAFDDLQESAERRKGFHDQLFQAINKDISDLGNIEKLLAKK